MPRTPRFIVPGLPHHITQRGNYRQPVFTSDGDRHFFLRRLNDRAQQYEIDVLAWCLMSNHFHLIAIPRREDSLALGLGALLSEYSLRMNTLRGEIRGRAH
jgi:putative transposase